MNNYVGLFLIPIIKKQLKLLNWGGNGATLSRLKNKKIKIPIDSLGKPYLDYMEQYIVNIIKQYKFPEIKEPKISDISLNSVKWGKFKIKELASVIFGGKDWKEGSRIKGRIPFVGSSKSNNGITDYVAFSKKRSNYYSKCVISINRNGNVGYAFYHYYYAYFSGDTRFLSLKHYSNNIYINKFICILIMMQKNKYQYGYKMGTERIKNQTILLPIDEKSDINWQFMEDYIKSIPNSNLL